VVLFREVSQHVRGRQATTVQLWHKVCDTWASCKLVTAYTSWQNGLNKWYSQLLQCVPKMRLT